MAGFAVDGVKSYGLSEVSQDTMAIRRLVMRIPPRNSDAIGRMEIVLSSASLRACQNQEVTGSQSRCNEQGC